MSNNANCFYLAAIDGPSSAGTGDRGLEENRDRAVDAESAVVTGSLESDHLAISDYILLTRLIRREKCG